MIAEILSVGTELLLGQITDTNATYISRALGDVGVDIHYRVTIGDNIARIVQGLEQALERADVVVLSGGLGPTTDDLTREAIAAVAGCDLKLDPGAKASIEAFFASIGRPMVEANLKQAMAPELGELLENPVGTAPGVYVPLRGKHIFAVPGVPHEMQRMIEGEVVPRLLNVMPKRQVIRSRVLRLTGIGESSMAELVEDILTGETNPSVAPLVGDGDVILRITAKGDSEEELNSKMADTEARLRERIGQYVYATGDEPIESWLIQTLAANRRTVAVAESCTGGLISNRLTNISGSSSSFMGSVVSYSNEAKTRILGIDNALIEEHGAVSAEVAEAMARGVRDLFGTDYGISATGIAGPTGGTSEKPVGLAFVGLAHAGGIESQRHAFARERAINKQRTSQAALLMLRNCLVSLS